MASKIIEVAGTRLYVDDQGDGEVLLLLHGFPDSHQLWRNQIPALTEAGYRTITPDLRGFGESDKPQDVDDYTADKLLGDVLGILDHLQIDKVHVICHDWGAFIGWSLAMFMPDRVKSLAALAVGHPAAFSTAGFDQKEKSWYMLLFQLDAAEEIIKADDWQWFKDWVRNHTECSHWIEQLSREGALTSGLNWYRANADPASLSSYAEFPAVTCPTLGVWASNDAYLVETQVVGSGRHVDANWEYIRLEGASHWMQLDFPDRINELLLDFLNSD
jgi:pimeloyl-ACP methyl ester carboxylesterase